MAHIVRLHFQTLCINPSDLQIAYQLHGASCVHELDHDARYRDTADSDGVPFNAAYNGVNATQRDYVTEGSRVTVAVGVAVGSESS